MTALASLSKFYGCYDRWLQIRQRYSLKWSSGNGSLQAMERFFNPEMSLDHMIEKVRRMIQVLPANMGQIVRFACITGLRPSEACESVRLILHPTVRYYNQEQQYLEHFRYPDIFLRTTKKCYLSYLSTADYQRIISLGPKTPTWTAIRLTCRRRNINMDMRLCRKIFASHLIKSAIDANTVDMLSGRCPPSVLARHYQVPSQDLKNRVLDAITDLQQQISC